MILYYGVTSYHVLCCMIHKMIWNPEKSAIFYLSDTHPEKDNLKKAIKNGKVFDQVELFPDKGRMLPYKKRYQNGEAMDQLIHRLEKEVGRNLPFSPENISEYNICGDQYGLGVWLIENQISYHYFEEGCGVYTRKYLLLENLKRLNPFQHDMAIQLNCMGNHPNITEKYFEFSAQEGNFNTEHCVDFSVKKLLKQLNEEELQQVLITFGVDVAAKKVKNATLLLTQQFVNMGFLNLKQEKELYDLMLDYFAIDDDICIKPHPSDWQGSYKEWYPKATVFPRFMPSELLPYCIEGNFKKGITVSSTSIFGLEGVLEDIICLDSSLEEKYLLLHSFYVVSALLKGENNITYQGEYPKLAEEMFQLYNIQLMEEGNIVFTDKEMLEPSADVMIYVSTHKPRFCNQIENHLENLYPIGYKICDPTTNSVTINYIYIYTKKKEFIQKIKCKEIRKVLFYANKEVIKSNDELEVENLALKGMLEVTNERVEYLLKENKKLREKDA